MVADTTNVYDRSLVGLGLMVDKLPRSQSDDEDELMSVDSASASSASAYSGGKRTRKGKRTNVNKKITRKKKAKKN